MVDEFSSVTRNDALLDLLRAEIAAQGSVSFQRFMEHVLYHPTLGYYRAGKSRIGERGDYVTSPYLSPLFGGIVGRQLAEMWTRLGEPSSFDLVEMGAGDGRLTRDIVAWAIRANPAFAATLQPLLVEPDPPSREAQARTLAHLPVTPRWVADLAALPPASVQGCFISNELVDAFPVRLFVVREGVPREVCVGWDGSKLVEVEGPPAPLSSAHDEGPSAYLTSLIARLPEGARFEVNEHARTWMQEVANRIWRGFALTFDYGYPAARLYAPWRTQGTLMAFYRHSISPDPLAHHGEQDLTAHVDFTALALAGRDAGLETAGFTSQQQFLASLGIHEAVSAPGLSLEETLARRRSVLTLLDPAGLGRVRVLAQSRGVDGAGLRGFNGAPPAWDTLLEGLPAGMEATP